jgi:hypothetical protein
VGRPVAELVRLAGEEAAQLTSLRGRS